MRENLEFVARLYGLRNPVKAARAMIERIGLGGREQLAGGCPEQMEAAPGARRLHAAEPAAAPARRADGGRRRPQGAAQFLERNSRALADEGRRTVLVSTLMDKAERCHEIAYIAYGDLLVHGTVEQVIAASHLTTLRRSAPATARS